MLLSSRSPFFHSAFNGSFKEAASSLLSMADDAPQVFDLVVRWMYTGTIDPMTVDDHGNGNGDGNSTGDCALTTTVAPFIYLQLFVLADKSQMPQLASSALHTIRAGLRCADAYLKQAQIVYVLNNTSSTWSLLPSLACTLRSIRSSLVSRRVRNSRASW